MKVTLTPQELRDLLILGAIPQTLRAPLDLDALLYGQVPGRPSTLLEDLEVAKADLERAIADIRQAKEELQRIEAMVADCRPPLEAEAVIANAGAQALDLARMFLLESSADAWYEGMRATLRNLLSTLGVEVEDETLEASLAPPEATGPTTELVSLALVPPAGPDSAEALAYRDALEVGDAPRQSQCKHCGEEIRFEHTETAVGSNDWIDRETHTTGEDGHQHEPAEDAVGEEIEF